MMFLYNNSTLVGSLFFKSFDANIKRGRHFILWPQQPFIEDGLSMYTVMLKLDHINDIFNYQKK